MMEPITLVFVLQICKFGSTQGWPNSPDDCTEHDSLLTTEDIRDEAGAQSSEP